MKKILLIQMLELAYKNTERKYIIELCLQIAVDLELDDIVTIESFSNEFYSVRSIRWINQCFNFKLI